MTSPQPCGTPAAYRRHLRADGIVTCRPCLHAHAQANNDRQLAPARRALLDAEVAAFERRRRRPKDSQ